MTQSFPRANRRRFLRLAAIGAAGLAAAPGAGAEAERVGRPPDVGRKFYANGRVHPLPGNTIICHLPQQGKHAAAFNAILDAYREAPDHAVLRKVALLPPSSYHMTVLNGLTDAPRRRETWPTDLPLDMPMADCNRIFAERLRAFALPIRMKMAAAQPGFDGGALTFRLQPLDRAEAAKLRDVRARLSATLRLPLPEPDGYHFHISFGYFLAWLTPAEQRAFAMLWARWAAAIAAKAPEIVLGAPEYCLFDDMFAFHRQRYIGSNA